MYGGTWYLPTYLHHGPFKLTFNYTSTLEKMEETTNSGKGWKCPGSFSRTSINPFSGSLENISTLGLDNSQERNYFFLAA